MASSSKEFGSVFDSQGWHKMSLSSTSLSHVQKMEPLERIITEHDRQSGLVQLLRSLLTIDPSYRATAGEVLKIPLFVHDS